MILADTLNHLLGTPGNDIATVTARRDKSEMAATVAAAGLAVPAGRCFESVDQAVAWYAASMSGPAVVKPVDSAGTDNVRFCESLDEVRLACATVLASSNLYGVPNRRVLVQERLVGTEFYVNTVSHAGTHRVAEIWRYTKRPGPGGGPIYDYEEPVDRGSALARQLREFVFAVLDALGIRSSAAHTELMLTDRGPVLIEAGARLGGATLPDVVAKFCGVSQTFLQAQHLVDPASLDQFDDRTPGWAAAVRNVSLINPAPVAAQAGTGAPGCRSCRRPWRSPRAAPPGPNCRRPSTCSARPASSISPGRTRPRSSGVISCCADGNNTACTGAADLSRQIDTGPVPSVDTASGRSGGSVVAGTGRLALPVRSRAPTG